MNIIERAREFVKRLSELAGRSSWDWRRCPRCGSGDTCRHGSYWRRVWSLEGHESRPVQRHLCHSCGRTYGEQSAEVAPRHRYGRDVQRLSLDQWCHQGGSLRRTAEFVRSLVGRQERYLLWRPWQRDRGPGEECRLSASTIGRWLDQAGVRAQESLEGQLAGVEATAVAADGLWTWLHRGGRRVVLMLVDCASGLVFPPIVAKGEGSEGAWARLFERARRAGLDLEGLRGVTSDWTGGLVSYLRRQLPVPWHQRCLWHFWRAPLGRLLGELGQEALPTALRLLRTLMSSSSYQTAEQALVALAAFAPARELAQVINEEFDHLFVHLLDHYRGLSPVSAEWCWRDFRLRLSRGQNHGSDERLERAALVWAIYHDFTPRQQRSERKRTYRHAGKSPLEVAGLAPGELTYLDALAV